MTRESTAPVEAWIDVGGTFTDCYVRQAEAALQRTKVLSSGYVPIAPTVEPAGFQVSASELRQDAENFWVGAQLRGFDTHGEPLAEARVIRSRGGVLELNAALPTTLASATLDAGLEAPVLAVRRLLAIPLNAPLPPLRIRLGTTKGTNALLTRRGARTALLITAPFEDLLHIGDQTRPDLFALAIDKPPPLAEVAVGIHERLDATGNALQALDLKHAREQLLKLQAAGVESLAICLMHSYLNPAHELALAKLASELGFTQISCSSQLAPLIEIVARAQTTVVDAYLSPIVRSYLAKLIAQFGGADFAHLLVMTSAGGLVDWRDYSGKDSILSGPAGGVAALREISRAIDHPRLIGLDMGGTSTDVCRAAEEHDLQYESTKAGIRILTPTLPIETVAAGGGSVCWFDGVSLRVGPQSAGAEPGPACYGRGGPLTITDLNMWLGRLPDHQFPFPLDRPAVETQLRDLQVAARDALGIDDLDELARGFRRIANAQMAEAVRTVSITQGTDPRTHALLGFGGAAGQHICEIAEILGITEVIDTPEAGLLSALGMGLADLRLDAAVAVYTPYDSLDWPALATQATAEAERLAAQLRQQVGQSVDIACSYWLELRYANTDFALTLPWPAAGMANASNATQLRVAFDELHRQRYGYARKHRPLEVVAVRIESIARGGHRLPIASPLASPVAESLATPLAEPSDLSHRQATASQALHTNILSRADIRPGEQYQGPCIILNTGSTLVVESGWQATALSEGTLKLSQCNSRHNRSNRSNSHTSDTTTRSTEVGLDPIFRDCFAQRLSAVATQMGIVLQQTAVSVNIKLRRDYSCAVFSATGQLLANAPHIPVHLGAMGRTVREVIERFPEISPGDCFITNDPYCGGSHLPDVTVITPVFATAFDHEDPVDSHRVDSASRITFFVANRAHHADIGGIAPGSMSITATRLGDEGVVIPPMHLTQAGEDNSATIMEVLRSSKFPPRNLQENLADIAAQQAANARGVKLLEEYAQSTGWNVLELASQLLLDAAEERVRSFITQRFDGSRSFVDYLDDGTPIGVQIDFLSQGRLRIDFSQSGETSPTNFNANPSIVSAAVMYVLRCLIADDLPLNEGVLRCVELVIPPGILNPRAASRREESPAVVAGNVETSQRVVDVLLGALGVAAASQGTMNNLLFGNANFGFYETICGGSGAIEGRRGASGVHSHMTNTRLTDPEVLEARYPVRLIAFGLRVGSGGAGRWPGGEGVVRCIEFLQAAEVSLLTSRRGQFAPFGLQGGSVGQLGCNTLIAADGKRQVLEGCCQFQIAAGQRLEIQTPGGGGFGAQS